MGPDEFDGTLDADLDTINAGLRKFGPEGSLKCILPAQGSSNRYGMVW